VDDRLIEVGRIVGVFGVAGWVKLHSYTEPRENLLRYAPWRVRREAEELLVERPEGKAHGRGLIARLGAIDDRDIAARWVGAGIWVARSALPRAAPGEVYWADLEGLAAVTVDGVPLGRVSHLFETGANDVLVLKGERERLVPYLPGSVVREVDLAGGRIVLDWDPDF
jgi:16S rRNA processing protein RimM